MSFALHIIRIVAFLMILYLLELGASYQLFPDDRCYAPFPGSQCILDTAYANNTIFATEPRLAVYGRAQLSHPGKKIVLVGASNVLQGFRPEQLSIYFPKVDIHNLSVGASNIKQLGEMVQLVLEAVPPKDHKDLTIVLGVWYGSFVDDSKRWKSGYTDVAAEMLRYGLYRENGTQQPTPMFGFDKMSLIALAMRPFMLPSHVYGNIKNYQNILLTKAMNYFFGMESSREVSGPQADVLTKEEKEAALRFWELYMGSPQAWGKGGFSLLLSMANKVGSTGARLMIIDMPIPSWHREHVPYDRIYQTRLLPYIEQLSSLPRFSYGSMRENTVDDEFIDSAHPHPKATQQWAERAAHIIMAASDK